MRAAAGGRHPVAVSVDAVSPRSSQRARARNRHPRQTTTGPDSAVTASTRPRRSRDSRDARLSTRESVAIPSPDETLRRRLTEAERIRPRALRTLASRRGTRTRTRAPWSRRREAMAPRRRRRAALPQRMRERPLRLPALHLERRMRRSLALSAHRLARRCGQRMHPRVQHDERVPTRRSLPRGLARRLLLLRALRR